MKKFWKWKDHRIRNADTGKETAERILFLNGTIAEENWFDDDITPALFKEELNAGSGNITVWINSPGGDCVAAAQIYNMLMDYKGDVTVKIDGIAASAASVIAMAGTKVLISPVGMIMIHNPSTLACGDTAEMKKAASMLDEVKESIINACEIKTSLPRQKLSRLMDAETWMDANKALELGFVDGILKREDEEDAFLNGTGSGQPLGLFADDGGGTVADTVSAIDSDSLISLVYALKRPYRKNASFIINDANLAVIRQLKDNNGAYIWQPSYQAGEPDRLLGYQVHTSAYAPTDGIAFGDYSYYNIGDRGTRSFKQLNELFAGNGMIGYVAKERVDGKLVLAEAVQILKIGSSEG